ncbi:hypothetical protein H0H93_016258 [Arthromyces matolae]|nr:hypothetical protein H0H93_016258 [Arthromyces matolae]
MKLISLTALICIVSFISNSAAAPVHEPNRSGFEPRSQELDERGLDETEVALIHLSRPNMKVFTLTALICLVFISTSAAAPTPEPSNSGSQSEARYQDAKAVQSQSQFSDETGKAVL